QVGDQSGEDGEPEQGVVEEQRHPAGVEVGVEEGIEAQRPAQRRRVLDHDHGQEGEDDREDREVVAAEAQRGVAENQGHQHRGEPGRKERLPHRPSPLVRQPGGGIRSAPGEDGGAAVEIAAVAAEEIPPLGDHHVEEDGREGSEHAHVGDEPEDPGATEDRHRDHGHHPGRQSPAAVGGPGPGEGDVLDRFGCLRFGFSRHQIVLSLTLPKPSFRTRRATAKRPYSARYVYWNGTKRPTTVSKIPTKTPARRVRIAEPRPPRITTRNAQASQRTCSWGLKDWTSERTVPPNAARPIPTAKMRRERVPTSIPTRVATSGFSAMPLIAAPVRVRVRKRWRATSTARVMAAATMRARGTPMSPKRRTWER